ncbi:MULTISPECIES: ABC transporter substrate-binding protein [Gordonibacter]|uniref:ABC transporter substrate-binding protein n=1 Tax=Gordonibacter faecis TaxID=3047475 RepID=A0ABT7DNY0_9ACTN|nr:MULTISPECIES: ABC transporter substrate-binding protein [unclassified Gordonibacter]MDJ1651246.1 ABC transporter substrate-binding protein [Gordonibacter sp. KGMB12511]HIW76370.1 ABC transporter substrate-binding protein [Candidatus Gordonibacter avicola]
MGTMTRRQFAKMAGAGAAALSVGGLLAGCASGGESAPAADKGDGAQTTPTTPNQVIVSMTPGSEPAAGFDPFVSWGCGEHVHEPLIQSTLITTDTDLNFVNDLATSYEASDDGMTWTFTIRNDVKFTDGQPLTARDVAFTLNGIRTGEASECDLSMVKEAVALDDTTVEIHMEKPFNALLYTLAVIGIVPEHAYDENYGDKPIGSGRYKLEQWDKGQQAILVANPDYYGDAPQMERVVVVFMEEDASLAAAQSGQVDVAYTAATFAANQPAGYDLLNCASVDSRGISLPCVPAGGTKVEQGDMAYEVGNDVTCDRAVRQAINYGVDRQKMIDNVMNGYGTVAFSVGDGMPWSSPDMQCTTDVDKAKKLLDDAGWTPGADGVREKDGVRASLNLYYSAGDSVRQAIAAEFANQMKDLGIEVSIKGASWDDLYPHQFTDPIVWGWGTNAPVETYNLFYSKGTGNYASYENPTVDAYLDEALAQPLVEDSFDFWKKAQWDGQAGIAPQGDAPWVWFANVDHLYFAKENLKVAKQKPHPHGHGWSLVNNVDQWSWA